jgi:hypothetical protein
MSNPFVQYLRQQGMLTAEQAQRIDAWASGRHDPIGIIAVEHGLILGRQIDEVLGTQRDTDWRFGQVAIELGHLGPRSTAQLLEIQRLRQWSRVAEAVVLAGIRPSDEVFSALARFVLEHGTGDASAWAKAA